MIVGVLNQKGGVGKTTLSINLADAWAKAGRKVLLVDADPQASSMAWSVARKDKPAFPVLAMAVGTLHRDLPGVAEDYDVVVIDGAPRLDGACRKPSRRSHDRLNRPRFQALLTSGSPKQTVSNRFCSRTVHAPAKPNPLRSHSMASNPWMVRRAVPKD
jgi:AAA domain